MLTRGIEQPSGQNYSIRWHYPVFVLCPPRISKMGKWNSCMSHIGPFAWTFTYQYWSRYLCMSSLPTMEMNAESTTWHYCLRRQTGTWWQVDNAGFLLSWQSQHFVLFGVDTYSNIFFGHGFDFSALTVWANTTMCGFLECLIHRNRSPHKQASHLTSQWTIFRRGALTMESTGCTIHSIQYRNFWLDKTLGWSLKGQLTCQLRGNTL